MHAKSLGWIPLHAYLPDFVEWQEAPLATFQLSDLEFKMAQHESPFPDEPCYPLKTSQSVNIPSIRIGDGGVNSQVNVIASGNLEGRVGDT